jgi:hypothetical protein
VPSCERFADKIRAQISVFERDQAKPVSTFVDRVSCKTLLVEAHSAKVDTGFA